MDDDPYLTVDEIEEQAGLSHVTARYVPKHLTNSRKAERVRMVGELIEI